MTRHDDLALFVNKKQSAARSRVSFWMQFRHFHLCSMMILRDDCSSSIQHQPTKGRGESAVRAIRCQSFASDRQDLSLYVKRLTSGISAPPIRTEHQATKNRHFASFQIITVPTWRGLGNHMILCSRKWRDSNHCIPRLYSQHEKTVF